MKRRKRAKGPKNFLRQTNLRWGQKNGQKAKYNCLGQPSWNGARFLTFGLKKTNLATLLIIKSLTVLHLRQAMLLRQLNTYLTFILVSMAVANIVKNFLYVLCMKCFFDSLHIQCKKKITKLLLHQKFTFHFLTASWRLLIDSLWFFSFSSQSNLL